MNIEDKFELLALHRCLFEAKFCAEPDDLDIAGSPIAAKLANQVVDELTTFEGQHWVEWRVAEKHPQRIEALISALKRKHIPEGLSEENKLQIVTNALAPLVATEGTINKIVKSVYG